MDIKAIKEKKKLFTYGMRDPYGYSHRKRLINDYCSHTGVLNTFDFGGYPSIPQFIS